MQHSLSVRVVIFCAVFSLATADFKTVSLNLHNEYRATHHAPPLTLSDEVVDVVNENYVCAPTFNYNDSAPTYYVNVTNMKKIHSLTRFLQLNKVAQNYAQQMATTNKFKHSGGKYGENIYMSPKTKLTDSEAAIEAINLWYNEKSKYNFQFGSFASSTGHFTQVVWNGSKYLGIGVARSSNGVYVCANYDPRGNVLTQFVKNVLAP